MTHAATEGVLPSFPEAVYAQLRAIAAIMLDREVPGHTLQPTALANEVYVRLATQHELVGAPREQLLAIGATMVRRVLVDHYRHKTALKRGGRGRSRIDLEQVGVEDQVDLLVVEEAIAKLERVDPRRARLVVLKFYGGMTVEQIAEMQGDSPRTVARDWAFARAWLGRELNA